MPTVHTKVPHVLISCRYDREAFEEVARDGCLARAGRKCDLTEPECPGHAGPESSDVCSLLRLSSTHRERRILFRVGLRLRALSCLVPPHRYGEWAVRPSRQKPRSAPQVPAGRAAGLSSALHSGLCPTQRPVSVAGKMTPGSSKRTSPRLSHSNKDPVAGRTDGREEKQFHLHPPLFVTETSPPP